MMMGYPGQGAQKRNLRGFGGVRCCLRHVPVGVAEDV